MRPLLRWTDICSHTRGNNMENHLNKETSSSSQEGGVGLGGQQEETWAEDCKDEMWSDSGSDSDGEMKSKRPKNWNEFNRNQPYWWNPHVQALRAAVFRSRRQLQRARRKKTRCEEDIDIAYAAYMHDSTVFRVAVIEAKARASTAAEEKAGNEEKAGIEEKET